VWLEVLGHVCERFNWVVQAYCQMGNRYHLLVETPDGNLAKGMRQLNVVHTQRFNQAHARVGHVFQGHHKAILVQKEAYLLEVSRYVVLNRLGTDSIYPLSPISRSSRATNSSEAYRPASRNRRIAGPARSIIPATLARPPIPKVPMIGSPMELAQHLAPRSSMTTRSNPRATACAMTWVFPAPTSQLRISGHGTSSSTIERHFGPANYRSRNCSNPCLKTERAPRALR
jgi:hypothetical protein